MTSDDEFSQVLRDVLSAYFGRPCAITSLRREPYIYSTSFALEDVQAEMSDGGLLRLIVKDLGASGMLQAARASKPAFLYEPRREIDTYQRLLDPVRLGTAISYGAVVDDDADRFWLFMEKVEGRELYQIGEVDVWLRVAGWLASMHGCDALVVESVRRRNPHLLSYDGSFYHRWLDRARGFAAGSGRTDEERSLSFVGRGLEVALERLAPLPTSFVHGEFYASNILVDGKPAKPRVCPVDWEMAGVGPALLDLAALCTGWDDEHVRAIAHAYHLARKPELPWRVGEEAFLMALRCCQLCLAVQWLGWAPEWTAPPEHARDWMGDALHLAEVVLT